MFGLLYFLPVPFDHASVAAGEGRAPRGVAAHVADGGAVAGGLLPSILLFHLLPRSLRLLPLVLFAAKRRRHHSLQVNVEDVDSAVVLAVGQQVLTS